MSVFINGIERVIHSGLILIWHGTIANIPDGYVICDGGGGTPNLLTMFIQGVATAATDPGATGGAVLHTHSIATVVNNNVIASENVYVQTNITGSTDGRPPFYDIAFLMKT
ncbi:hypothetical protein ES703_47261 [subsurface metagenome]